MPEYRPNRIELLDQLLNLMPAQLELVIFRLHIPSEVLPTTTKAERAIATVQHLEHSKKLDQLTKILIDGLGHGRQGEIDKSFFARRVASAAFLAVLLSAGLILAFLGLGLGSSKEFKINDLLGAWHSIDGPLQTRSTYEENGVITSTSRSVDGFMACQGRYNVSVENGIPIVRGALDAPGNPWGAIAACGSTWYWEFHWRSSGWEAIDQNHHHFVKEW